MPEEVQSSAAPQEGWLDVENGTLLVDAWTARHDVNEVKFLYISIPGQGTVIAWSSSPFAAKEIALEGKTLTIKFVNGHPV